MPRSIQEQPNKALHPTIGRGRPLAGERQGVMPIHSAMISFSPWVTRVSFLPRNPG